MLRLEKVPHNEAAVSVLDFDVNSFGVAVFLDEDNTAGTRTVRVEDQPMISWDKRTWAHARHVRWIGSERVALWSTNSGGEADTVTSIGYSDHARLPIRTPSSLFSGREVLFACYGEDQGLASDPLDLESNMVVATDLNGKFIFGLAEQLKSPIWPGTPLEVTVGCVTPQDHFLFAIYRCEDLWLLNPFARSLERVAFPGNVEEICALSVVEDRVIFAVKEPTAISFRSANANGKTVSSIGLISYGEIFARGNDQRDRSRLLRAHGSITGQMLLLAGSEPWSVEF